jgi:tRNA threonylcarbamoyl adenosine modification protein (Sua5/YciO/YrdC/YwlC family)
MLTKILDTTNDKDSAIREAIEWLQSGIPISFPTETVYGLGAGIFDYNGVEKIYKIKGRAFNNPLSAHISNLNDVEILCDDIKDDFYLLAEKFLPGPLSIVMKKKKVVTDIVTGGGGSLSIRIPDNPIFLELSKLFGQPIAGTSANKSGRPSPTNAEFVYDDLAGEIPVILDSGKCRYQIESTVISLLGDSPELIRPGAISQTDLQNVLSKQIISRNRQIVLADSGKNPINNLKFRIIYNDNYEEIQKLINANFNKKMILMSRNPEIFDNNLEKIKTEESTFFDQLRLIEKNEFEILLVHIDEYIKSSEVLRHRLGIN